MYPVVGTALAPPQPCEHRQSVQMFIRHCAHKATGIDPQKSGPGTCHTYAPGPDMGARESVQTLALPPHAHVLKACHY